jgi:DNA polymerase III epsilon subunit-like protein
MSLSYCAIDFETANWFRGSPCAVGLVKVVDGAVVDARRYLMRPPTGYDEFEAFNISLHISLHGITPEMVRDEPRFAQRLPQIIAFAAGLPFVAHNAAFDMGVIRDACNVSDLTWPELSYTCTLVLSRVTWSLLSYSLPWVAEAAGIRFDHRHDPDADARAAAAILLAVAAHHNATTFDDLATATGVRLGSMGDGVWCGCHRVWSGGAVRRPRREPERRPEPPLLRTGDGVHRRSLLDDACAGLGPCRRSWRLPRPRRDEEDEHPRDRLPRCPRAAARRGTLG